MYTKGPWRAVVRANQHGIASVAVDTSATGGLVWRPKSKLPNNMFPPSAADDANLIAAAPEMFEALEAMVEVRNYVRGPKKAEITRKARAALAKARGET